MTTPYPKNFMMMQSPFMEKALEEAKAAFARDEVPVGAVIVDSNTDEIIAAASNRSEALLDPTAHAEMLAIRQACEQKGTQRLVECDMYVTLEPCPMCAQAISFARIRRLYYAASDPKGGGVEHGAKIFHSPSCHHTPEIYSGIGEAESALLLKEFFQQKR